MCDVPVALLLEASRGGSDVPPTAAAPRFERIYAGRESCVPYLSCFRSDSVYRTFGVPPSPDLYAVLIKGTDKWAPQMGIFLAGLAAGNIWFGF